MQKIGATARVNGCREMRGKEEPNLVFLRCRYLLLLRCDYHRLMAAKWNVAMTVSGMMDMVGEVRMIAVAVC